MADDNKNLAGDTERTSILPQSEPQVADQTEVLPTHVSQAQTARLRLDFHGSLLRWFVASDELYCSIIQRTSGKRKIRSV